MTGTAQGGPGTGGGSGGKRKAGAGTSPMHDPNATPMPGDPQKITPEHDPPMNPERDPSADQERLNVLPDTDGGVKAPDPSPDRVVFDENKEAR